MDNTATTVATLADLQTDLCLRANLPPMSPESLDSIEQSILRDGITEPLIVWGSQVIDGCARLQLYLKLGFERCPVFEVELEDEAAAIRERIRRNCCRRHLNNWQRAMLALDYISSFMEKRANGKGDKWAEASAMVGVSTGLMSQAQQVHDYLVDPKLCKTSQAAGYLADLENGKTTIGQMVSKKKIKKKNNKNGTGSRAIQVNDFSANPKGGKRKKRKPSKYINVINEALAAEHFALIPDESVTLVVTSPPYLGVIEDHGGNWNPGLTIDRYKDLMRETLEDCYRVLRPGGIVALNIDEISTRNHPDSNERKLFFRYPVVAWLELMAIEIGYWRMGPIIWDKQNAPGQGNQYGAVSRESKAIRPINNHEYILLFAKGNESLKNITNAPEDIRQEDAKLKAMSPWQFGPQHTHRKTKKNPDGHPHPFPEKLIEQLVLLFSFEGDLVLDPFCGSGTTCAVAKQMNRQYSGCDCTPEYVEYANERVNQVA